LASNAEPDRNPLPGQIGILGIIEGLSGERCHQQSRRHSGDADRAAVPHALPSVRVEIFETPPGRAIDDV
jgi:hypothetical protein